MDSHLSLITEVLKFIKLPQSRRFTPPPPLRQIGQAANCLDRKALGQVFVPETLERAQSLPEVQTSAVFSLTTVCSHAPRMCSPLSCLSPTLHTVCLVWTIPVEVTKTRYLQGDQTRFPWRNELGQRKIMQMNNNSVKFCSPVYGSGS